MILNISIYNISHFFSIILGQILWRRVLEKGLAGRIRGFSNGANGELISVSGEVPAIVRYWNLATGHILNEWTLAEQNPDRLVS